MICHSLVTLMDHLYDCLLDVLPTNCNLDRTQSHIFRLDIRSSCVIYPQLSLNCCTVPDPPRQIVAGVYRAGVLDNASIVILAWDGILHTVLFWDYQGSSGTVHRKSDSTTIRQQFIRG
eukprot:scaffold565474_cov134-Attheya_sp.AAC.1